MFENKHDIYAFLADTGLSPYAATLEELCLPALAFHPEAKPVAARFGGLPDLLPISHGRFATATRADTSSPTSSTAAATLRKPSPCRFRSNFWRSSTSQRSRSSKRWGTFLPFEGRLLFFWDGICGPWIDTAASCRVIWDRSSPARRVVRGIPDALRTMMTRTGREGFKPAKKAGLVEVWTMPDRGQFKDMIDDDDILDALDSDDADGVFDAQMNLGMAQLKSGREVLPHRVGGWPYPEQWDPRFTAAASAKGVLKLFQRQPNAVERAVCEAEMHDWTLLLQVGLADVTTDFGRRHRVLRHPQG